MTHHNQIGTPCAVKCGAFFLCLSAGVLQKLNKNENFFEKSIVYQNKCITFATETKQEYNTNT